MSYLCYICRREIRGTCKLFMKHLRIYHQANTVRFSIVCYQDGCMRSFSLLWCLKRHILKNHNKDEPVEAQSEVRELLVSEPDIADDDDDDADTISNMDTALEELDVTCLASTMLSKLKSNPSCSLSTVHTVMTESSQLISEILGYLKQKTSSVLIRNGVSIENQDCVNLMKEFGRLRSPFDTVDTTYSHTKYMEQQKSHIKATSIPLGVNYSAVRNPVTGCVEQKQKTDTLQYIDIKELLSMILETPGVLDEIKSYKSEDDGILRGYHDGKLFKNKSDFVGDRTVCLLLYSDDLEVVNPLGAKTGIHKVFMMYFSILNVHPRHTSALKHLYLLICCLSRYLKTYGVNKVVEKLVEDLIHLEKEGLAINCPTFSGTVLVRLAQITGDNLGLHELLGFAGGFTANFPCKNCKMHRTICHTSCMEDVNLMRNMTNFSQDLEEDNMTVTGIKFNSLFNNLDKFHAIENLCPEIMHDILEGVGALEVKLVLKELLIGNVLTLEEVNSRIQGFDYGFLDSHNKPSEIKLAAVNNPDGAAGQNAIQMYCLLRYLPLMVGNVVSDDDHHWELILLLVDIMDIIFAPDIHEPAIIFLQQTIREHHTHFLEVFPERHLKPKHHHMTHYPNIISKIGPLINYWAMRFEAKHKFFKSVANSCFNFKNIPKTFAQRHQLQLSYQNPDYSSTTDVGPGSLTPLRMMGYYDIITEHFPEIDSTEPQFFCHWVIFNGIKYRPGMTLMIEEETEDDEPVFGKIASIMVYTVDLKLKVYFICNLWEVSHFKRHYHAYCATRSSSLLKVLEAEELTHVFPLHAAKCFDIDDQNHYIVPRYRSH